MHTKSGVLAVAIFLYDKREMGGLIKGLVRNRNIVSFQKKDNFGYDRKIIDHRFPQSDPKNVQEALALLIEIITIGYIPIL